MPKINIEDLTAEQQVVIEVFVNEGKMQAYEELLAYFEHEYNQTASEDPYYGYYVKYVIDKINERYQPMVAEVNE